MYIFFLLSPKRIRIHRNLFLVLLLMMVSHPAKNVLVTCYNDPSHVRDVVIDTCEILPLL